MDLLIAQVLLAGASVSAGYAVRLRGLPLVLLGTAFAGAFILQAESAGHARWGWVAVGLNLLAGAFVLGFQRGADRVAPTESLT